MSDSGASQIPGLLEEGNIDLHSRPVVRDPETGMISTVRSMGIEEDGRQVLIPTVSRDGKSILSPDEAIRQYHSTGEHLGKFDTIENSNAYGQQLHEQQAREYLGPQSRASSSPELGVNPLSGMTPEEELKALSGTYEAWRDWRAGNTQPLVNLLAENRQSRLPADPENLLTWTGLGPGIFAGRGAMMSPRNAFEAGTAISDLPAELSGESPQRAYESTGWFKGPDDQWRFTISDAPARLKGEALQVNQFNPDIYWLKEPEIQRSQPVPEGLTKEEFDKWMDDQMASRKKGLVLGDLLHHPDLFDAYPDLADIAVKPTHSMAALEGLQGYYDPRSNTIGLTGGKPENMMSTLLHEIQHAVQFREGFAVGGNTGQFLPAGFDEAYKALTDKWQNFADHFRGMGLNPLIVKQGLQDRIAGREPMKFRERELSQIPEDTLARAHELVDALLPMDRAKNYAREQYLRLGGEVESRTVQEQFAQQDWSRLPWEYEGYVPVKDQILNFATFPVEHDPFAGAAR